METKAKIGLGLVVILVIAIISEAWYRVHLHWIPAGSVGVAYSSKSGVDRSHVITPQAVYVGPMTQIYDYPTKVMNAVYTQDQNSGEVKSADGIQITTNDTANTTFDISVLYRIKKEDVFTVLDKFGTLSIEDIQSQHIRRAVKEEASVIGNRYNIYELMTNKRMEASDALTKQLQDKLGLKGITILHAMILTAYPSDSLLQKIHNNVNSVTSIQIAQLEQEISAKQNQINIVNAEAQQQAQKIAGNGTGAKSLEIIDLELAQSAAQKWNGHLPTVTGGNRTVVVNATDGKVVPTRGE